MVTNKKVHLHCLRSDKFDLQIFKRTYLFLSLCSLYKDPNCLQQHLDSQGNVGRTHAHALVGRGRMAISNSKGKVGIP